MVEGPLALKIGAHVGFFGNFLLNETVYLDQWFSTFLTLRHTKHKKKLAAHFLQKNLE